MNDSSDDTASDTGGNHREASEREDLLFHRAIERNATEAEWREIELAASSDADLWRRLSEQLRDDGLITARSQQQIAAADRVELSAVSGRAVRSRSSRLLRSPFSGWLAAAAVLALWIGRAVVTPSPHSDRDPVRPGHPPRLVADGGLTVDTGLGSDSAPIVRVSTDGNVSASSMPRILVDAKRSGDGYELLYLCRSFERVRVPLLYATALDENGNAAAVPVSAAAVSAWEEF
jgi:hypothetical protein